MYGYKYIYEYKYKNKIWSIYPILIALELLCGKYKYGRWKVRELKHEIQMK